MLSKLILQVAGMEREESQDYRPRPSIAGPDRCIRQLCYWSQGYQRDKELADRYILTIDDSTFHEYLTGDWINKTAFKLHSQQMEVVIDLHPGLVFKGHIDGIITDMLGVDRLYEHKAINHFSFQRYLNGEIPRDWITQGCLYLKGLQKVNPDITEMVLMVKNKNTAQYIDYRIALKDDVASIVEVETSTGDEIKIERPLENVLRDVAIRFMEVERNKQMQIIPARPYPIDTTFPCGYCSWEFTCDSAEMELFDSNIKRDVIDLSEIGNLLIEYNQIKQIEDANKPAKEALRESIASFMRDNHALKGFYNGTSVSFKIKQGEKITEALTIRSPKTKGGE